MSNTTVTTDGEDFTTGDDSTTSYGSAGSTTPYGSGAGDDSTTADGSATAGHGSTTPDAVLIGSCVGAGVLVVLVLCCIVCVCVLARRRKKNSHVYSVVKKRNGKPLDKGFTNALYTYDENVVEIQKLPNHDYSLPHDINSKQAELEQSYSYAYASTERRIPEKTTSSQRHSNSSRYGKEQTYMSPASEESALYAQIVDFRIPELSRTSIELQDVIGTGNFGTVHQGVMNPSSGGKVEVAVKTLKEGSTETDRVKFLQEAAIMGQFRHPNVVKVHGMVTENEPVFIVLELLAKGDLRNYLLSQQEESSLSIDEHTLLSYCRQVASGMVYLSNKAFVHRDLAARNILLSDQGLCKIADFGLSRDLMDEEYYVSQGGKIPVKWTAPEALHYRKYSTASDVWSYGVLLFEIWSIGKKPYEEQSVPELLRRLEDGYRLAPPPGTPRTVYELMVDTWNPITSLRPSFSDIMQQLSLPDTILLQGTSENLVESSKLGDKLSYGLDLYIDLQHKYV